jgi:hypothetical protein
LPLDRLFPSLRVLVCWQGGNMGYYLDELRANMGERTLFEFPVSASEGIIAIPNKANVAGGIVAVTSAFLEFIPEDDPEAEALTVDQIETGATYRVIMTTSGGLYRYDIGDLVRVTGSEVGTPTVEFVSRADRRVSISNERINENDVTVAMTEASRIVGLRVPQFLFVPCSDRRYRVILDGGVVDSASDTRRRLPLLAAELEHQFRDCATGYDFEREDALLRPLEVVLTPPGELTSHLAATGAPTDVPNAQVKPMHLTSEVNAHNRFAMVARYAT